MRGFRGYVLASVLVALGCEESGAVPPGSGGSGVGGGTSVAGGAGAEGGASPGSGGGGGGGSGGGGSGGTMGSGGSGGAGGGGLPSGCDVSFGGPDGNAWPAPWIEAGGVQLADIQGSRGRLTPTLSNYSLARLTCAGNDGEVELLFNLAFTDVATQGLGVYGRQNGGYLALSTPTGSGYGVFVEGFSGSPGIGVWYERDGIEIKISDAPFTLLNQTTYWVRYRVEQTNTTSTRLRARIWADGDSEPTVWAIDIADSQDHLQGVSGGFAVDAWSTHTPGDGPAADLFFDELTILPL